MNNLAFFYNVANFENVQLYTPTFNFSSFKQLNSLQYQWNGPERSNRLFTRPISECDFAVSQSLLQIIIIFVFWLMAQPNAKSDSRVNRPLNSNFIPTKNYENLIQNCSSSCVTDQAVKLFLARCLPFLLTFGNPSSGCFVSLLHVLPYTYAHFRLMIVSLFALCRLVYFA